MAALSNLFLVAALWTLVQLFRWSPRSSRTLLLGTACCTTTQSFPTIVSLFFNNRPTTAIITVNIITISIWARTTTRSILTRWIRINPWPTSWPIQTKTVRPISSRVQIQVLTWNLLSSKTHLFPTIFLCSLGLVRQNCAWFLIYFDLFAAKSDEIAANSIRYPPPVPLFFSRVSINPLFEQVKIARSLVQISSTENQWELLKLSYTLFSVKHDFNADSLHFSSAECKFKLIVKYTCSSQFLWNKMKFNVLKFFSGIFTGSNISTNSRVWGVYSE